MRITQDQLPDNFVSFLKNELLIRNSKNPRYSLRSFAKSLNLSSSFLSKLLNGKRALTEETFNSITARLALSPQIENHYRREEFENALVKTKMIDVNHKKKFKPDAKLKKLKDSDQEFKKITMDQFSLIADWYHFALLELLSTEGFILNSNFVASRLNISSLEAKHAIDRLLRLGLIKEKANKKGEVTYFADNHTSINKRIATAATLKQQKAFLEKAIDALSDTPIEERSQSSMTLSIPKSKLKEAEMMIHDFRRTFTSLMQQKEVRDSVYQLSISFFPLTK